MKKYPKSILERMQQYDEIMAQRHIPYSNTVKITPEAFVIYKGYKTYKGKRKNVLNSTDYGIVFEKYIHWFNVLSGDWVQKTLTSKTDYEVVSKDHGELICTLFFKAQMAKHQEFKEDAEAMLRDAQYKEMKKLIEHFSDAFGNILEFGKNLKL